MPPKVGGSALGTFLLSTMPIYPDLCVQICSQGVLCYDLPLKLTRTKLSCYQYD